MGNLRKIISIIIFCIVLMVAIYGYHAFKDKMNYVDEQNKQIAEAFSNNWFSIYQNSKEVMGSQISFIMDQAEGENAKVLVKTLANRQGVEYSKNKRYNINDINDDNYINENANFNISAQKDKYGKITEVILDQVEQ